MADVQVGGFTVGNAQPLTLIGGVNVIESRDLVMEAAEAFIRTTQQLAIPYIFKASFDKANRSSIHSNWNGKYGISRKADVNLEPACRLVWPS